MHSRHFLARIHRMMTAMGHDWVPGSTTWRHFCDVSDRTVRRAMQAGYLARPTRGSIPVLTRKGYREF